MRIEQEDLEILRDLELTAEDLRAELVGHLEAGSEIAPGRLSFKNGKVVEAGDSVAQPSFSGKLSVIVESGQWSLYLPLLIKTLLASVFHWIGALGGFVSRSAVRAEKYTAS